MKKEVDSFRHYGVDCCRDALTGHCSMSQESYLDSLTPIDIDRVRGSGRTAESPASAFEVTEYRSLVSAIAWAGVTSAQAQASASMYQSFVPGTTIANITHLNECLKQLRADYHPLIFRHDLGASLRIVVVADSSLANMSKYSQGGHHVLLCSDHADRLCSEANFLASRSGKSKRVASSTMHAETLSLVGGVEEAVHLQGWLYELDHPEVLTLDLINIESNKLIPIITATDCEDVHCALVAPVLQAPTNRSLTLYLSALRELRDIGRIQAHCWIDTEDNLANVLTKLCKDGTTESELLVKATKYAFWEPLKLYKWNSQYTETEAREPHPLWLSASQQRKSVAAIKSG